MGYYTHFTLTVEQQEEGWYGDVPNLIAELRKENANAEYAVNDRGQPQNGTKWYEWKRDLKDFTRRRPGVIRVDWEGEEHGDTGTAYFKNGRMALHEAIPYVPPAFREEDLK